MKRGWLFLFGIGVTTLGVGWINYSDTFYPGIITAVAGCLLCFIQLKSFILEVLGNGR